MAFAEYQALGNVFYNIIKSDQFYKEYCDLIFKNMKDNHINYQEMRLKLEFKDRHFICTTKHLLEHLMHLNNKKREY